MNSRSLPFVIGILILSCPCEAKGPEKSVELEVTILQELSYRARGLTQLEAGELLLVGDRIAPEPEEDAPPAVALCLISESGQILWNREYDNLRSAYGRPSCPFAGGFLVIGNSAAWLDQSSDIVVVKVDRAGNIIWRRTFDSGGAFDWGSSIVQAQDQGFVFGGVTNSKGAGGLDFLVTRIDAEGNRQWEKTYGRSGHEGNVELGPWISCTSDGGFILCGSSATAPRNGTFEGVGLVVLKLDQRGDLQWQRILGGRPVKIDVGYSIAEMPDGEGYVVVGTRSNGPWGVWVIQMSVDGQVEKDTFVPGEIFISPVRVAVAGKRAFSIGTRAAEGAAPPCPYVFGIDGDGRKSWELFLRRFEYATVQGIERAHSSDEHTESYLILVDSDKRSALLRVSRNPARP